MRRGRVQAGFLREDFQRDGFRVLRQFVEQGHHAFDDLDGVLRFGLCHGWILPAALDAEMKIRRARRPSVDGVDGG